MKELKNPLRPALKSGHPLLGAWIKRPARRLPLYPVVLVNPCNQEMTPLALLSLQPRRNNSSWVGGSVLYSIIARTSKAL